MSKPSTSASEPFSSELQRSKRATILLSGALLALSLPQVTLSDLDFAGVKVTGLGSSFILLIIAAALTYNYLMFFDLFSREAGRFARQEAAGVSSLIEMLDEVKGALSTEHHLLTQLADNLEAHSREVSEAVRENPLVLRFTPDWTEQVAQALSYGVRSAVAHVYEAYRPDGVPPEIQRDVMVDRNIQAAMRTAAETASQQLAWDGQISSQAFVNPGAYRELTEAARNAVARWEQSAGRADSQLRRALFTARLSRGRNRFRLWVLEFGVPTAMVAVALLHFVGRLWVRDLWPSLPTALSQVGILP